MIEHNHGKYIFISYSSKERGVAENFKNALEKKGVEVWIAPESIPVGSNYVKSIVKAIRESRAMIVLLSEKSQNSEWVQSEVEMAKNTGIPICPVRIEDCEILDEFRLLIGIRQTVDCFGIPDDTVNNILAMLKISPNTDGGKKGAQQKENGTEPLPLAKPNGSAANNCSLVPCEFFNMYEPKEMSMDSLNERVSMLEDVVAEIIAQGGDKNRERIREQVKVVGVILGPQASRYEVELPSDANVSILESRAAIIAYELAVDGGIRIQPPSPGKHTVGIEMSNFERSVVGLRDIVASNEFCSSPSPCTFVVGKDIFGKNVICDLNKSPHFLAAGITCSGKSMALHSMIVSLMCKASPEDVRFILIDPKRVEFARYRGMPHMLTENVITDRNAAVKALQWAIDEMNRRYGFLSKYNIAKISDYNQSREVKSGKAKKLPHIVIVIDELADLMLSECREEAEKPISIIGAMGRAAGVHLIAATQRATVNVVTDKIKSVISGRIALRVLDANASRVIIDENGAETLAGNGDMLFFPVNYLMSKRVQGAYVDSNEVVRVINYCKDKYKCDYDRKAECMIFGDSVYEEEKKNMDPLTPKILADGILMKQISCSVIQRRYSIGYARASRIIDQLDERGYIGGSTGSSRPRDVLITRERFFDIFGFYPEEV